jgi:hypothetical protein
MNHKEKIKLARKLRTQQEIKAHISIWSTKGWELRKKAIKNRISKRIILIQKRKSLKKFKDEK